jgi:arginine deiminase
VTRNHSLWDAGAVVLGLDKVTVLAADEDIRAAEREQWDDRTNYLAVAPGVVMGYERNVPTNTMLRRNGHRGHSRGPAPRTLLQDHARQRWLLPARLTC